MPDYDNHEFNDLDKLLPYDTDSVYTAAPALRQIKAFIKEPNGLLAYLSSLLTVDGALSQNILSIVNANLYPVGSYYVTKDNTITTTFLHNTFGGTWEKLPDGTIIRTGSRATEVSPVTLVHRVSGSVIGSLSTYSLTWSGTPSASNPRTWSYTDLGVSNAVKYTLEIFSNKKFNLYASFNGLSITTTRSTVCCAFTIPDLYISKVDTALGSGEHPYTADAYYVVGCNLNPTNARMEINVSRAYNFTDGELLKGFATGTVSNFPETPIIQDVSTMSEVTNVFVRTA